MSNFLLKIAALIISALSFSPALAADKWIEKTSNHNVDVTTENPKKAIEGAKATLFAVIDHKAGAEQVGLQMNNAKVVIFGNPKLGTPLMLANPKAALDLPIKVLIWEEDGTVKLGALSPESFSKRYNLSGVDKQLLTMDGALHKLMSKAAE